MEPATPTPDPRGPSPVEHAVTRAEAQSSAEIVVVLAGRSDPYGEIPWIVGALAGWACLAFLSWAPPVFGGGWFPVDVLLVGGIAGALARMTPKLAKILVSDRTRHARVKSAAEAAFIQEAVHGTRARTGVLVYASALEDEVVVLADQGVLAAVPAAEWVSVRFDGAGDASVVAGIDALGAVLGRHLPARAGDNPDEISNAPRRRP